MVLAIKCRKVEPTKGCPFVAVGGDILEVLQNAAVHARGHGRRPTPELVERVSHHIEEI